MLPNSIFLLMEVEATEAATDYGNGSWPNWQKKPVWKSKYHISLPEHRNGTKLNTDFFATLVKTGKVSLYWIL